MPKGQDRDLAKARAAARRELQEQRAEIERVGGKKALENLEMDVETDADGQPAFIMVTAGVVKRTFGGADASSRRSDEVAYVSPASLGTLLVGPWRSVIAEFWPPKAMAMLA